MRISIALPIPAARDLVEAGQIEEEYFSGKAKYSCMQPIRLERAAWIRQHALVGPEPRRLSADAGSVIDLRRRVRDADDFAHDDDRGRSCSQQLVQRAREIARARRGRTAASRARAARTSTPGRQRSSMRSTATASPNRTGGRSRSGVVHCAAATLTGQSVVS